MQGPTKSEWRSVVRGNAPVRYERADGAWVEVRATRDHERAVYEVATSRGRTARCEKYFEALTQALKLRDAWDRFAKRKSGRA